jgi:hypothetical protein
MGPFAFGPWLNEFQVLSEVDSFQLVVDKLPNIPWQIIVAKNNKRVFKI